MTPSKVPPAILYAASAALLAFITWLDYVTGTEFDLFVLYLLPVGLASWAGSRRAGLSFACAAALCWYASDRFAGHSYSQSFFIYWAAFMRFVSYLITALALSGIKDAVRRQEDLLRVVSHDLRAPLTAIAGQAHILRARALGDPWIRDRSDAIIRASKRMDSMIADLVDGAAQAAGHLRLALQPVELQSYVAELMGRMQGSLEIERVDLALAARGTLVVKADPSRLERVLVNLISNALKYSPPESRVQVDAEANDGRVIISVSDQGPGIAPEEMEHLFERYYRGRAARQQAGLGVGLHSARLLVEAHGGRIYVVNSPGGGATFRVELQAA